VEWFDPDGPTTVDEAAGFFADLLIDGVGEQAVRVRSSTYRQPEERPCPR
jgi:hypothetical protein